MTETSTAAMIRVDQFVVAPEKVRRLLTEPELMRLCGPRVR